MQTKNLSSLLNRKYTDTRGYIDYVTECEYPYNYINNLKLIKKSHSETILYYNKEKLDTCLIEKCIGYDSNTSIAYYISYEIPIENIKKYYEDQDITKINIRNNINQEIVYESSEPVYHIVLRYNDYKIDSCFKLLGGDMKIQQFKSYIGYDNTKDDLNWECWDKEKVQVLVDLINEK